ncbi:cytochrome c oxidase assembly factor 1 homolog [Acanthaster planci]|uniref:Cytochrome c oxidase assembly factor 1 homolog n=1 Tax=Acanthaster planci TaxID=133434 RepID=A0A8B7ZZA5_ACAPL|nr:cytochrome c oxidase assembly factor 1 homolog [Acanthaster planci]XP_022110828.1 cytochrome c oxidase assembly factor 1 homolog [Acanthaster planci]XP_022110835.1 cytochrome c oxidase assembly factor 1 homolog [Acanthaster planci]XP_022110841.1 cytochrome c oxidase assembly factor 1 homolog [Acanthaster planci]XP_022110853.1 cytochrome c oxidase assembly factor 1 homolog [Acanthaster planci]XP_022110860.1 cytochrome c oxidase assembly factor 1 homolog [Acanthaster planci]XP_022110869.1 cy
MMSLSTLKKIAAYGGVVSVLGAGYFFKRIQDGLAAGSYYSQSMKILREHPGASEVLGHPIRSKFLNLGDPFNVVNSAEAKLAIPVKGSKRRGTLYTWSDRQGLGWEVRKLQLQLKGTERKVTIYALGASTLDGNVDNRDTTEILDD